ncbi:MAG TPA: histidine phosphatase family protein [Anaerolineales bacterium]|nr:histidine phosphatase family protein [Anaerolineales bacterium]
MTHLYLIRHGETDWNVEGRWQGQADVPLNGKGKEQAAQIAQELAQVGLQAIYSSDLVRARETAKALAMVSGLSPLYDPRLREIDQGEWQGLLVTEIQARYGEAFQRRLESPLSVAPPGGETVEQVRTRVVSAIEDILVRYPIERVAVVSHGFALALVQVHYLGLPIQQVWERVPKNDEWIELLISPFGESKKAE